MKALQFAILFLSLNLSSVILAQPQLTICINGSITYSAMKDISDFYISWDKFDLKNFNLSWEAEARNYISNSDVFYISVTKINTQIDISGGQNPIYLTRKFEAIPVTIDYERIFTTTSSLKPYLGVGLSLVRASTKLEGLETEMSWHSHEDNAYGFELKFGILSQLISWINLRAEIQYNYHSDVKTTATTDVTDFNLSGIGIYLGTEIKIF